MFYAFNIVFSLSSDPLTRYLPSQEWLSIFDGLKYSLNMRPHLVQVCLPKILLTTIFLSTFKLITHDIF